MSCTRAASLLATILLAAAAAPAETTLATGRTTEYAVVVDPDATVAERHAADELARFLAQVTGASFPVIESAQVPERPALIVGPGRAARALAPDLSFDDLAPDGIIIETRRVTTLAPADLAANRTRALPSWETAAAAALRDPAPTPPGAAGADRASITHLILAGDRPRGTLYAVYRFLEDTVGCRWWTSTASTIPDRPELTVPDQHVRYVPPLEYREVFWWDAFDGEWAARNQSNGNRPRLEERHGGHWQYAGFFVHTFDGLVPPAQHFAEHPEWFSERNGVRIGADGARTQLCLTNPEVLNLTEARVRERLVDNPQANIVSVSQNDWDAHCLCPECAALDESDGSPAGPLLRFVNAVAERIGPDHPEVAVDTLAYQYTRKPPANVVPLPNVIVRLCSIECSFLQPLSSDANASFGNDLRGWNQISDRLWVWDYTTNFGHYILPHPNLRVLGPNIRFFIENGVTGIFEQGAYQSPGGEMAPLRAWMLAKLLWDPSRDTDALIAEFTEGYYGPAGRYVREYLDLLHDTAEATGYYMRIWGNVNAPYLTLDLMGRSWALFGQAEAAVADDPELLARVQMARLPLRYVWAMRWHEFEAQARREGIAWPGPDDYVGNAQTFMEVARAHGVTKLSEGAGIEVFENRTIGLGRIASPPPPGCEDLAEGVCIDLQDNAFRLAREGSWATLTHDDLASDHVAVRMPGDHYEWATQLDLGLAGLDPEATYSVYAAVRVEKTAAEGLCFSAGVYDVANKAHVGGLRVECDQVTDDAYHVYRVTQGKLHGQMYVWIAPPRRPGEVQAVWVDRIWLVRED